MRRIDKEIKDMNKIEEIISKCKTCHLAMIDGEEPYVVPLSFGYIIKGEELVLYFHSAFDGRKIDILKKNSKVCFEMFFQGELVCGDNPCDYGYLFSSVIGFGYAEFVNDGDEKKTALKQIVKHQANINVELKTEQAKNVCVFRVSTKSFIGKAKLI